MKIIKRQDFKLCRCYLLPLILFHWKEEDHPGFIIELGWFNWRIGWRLYDFLILNSVFHKIRAWLKELELRKLEKRL